MGTADVYASGQRAASAILREVFRIDVVKALNPLNRRDFLVISNRLSSAMRRAGAPESVAMRAAIDSLDVDWPNLTVAQRDAIVRAARASIVRSAPQVLPQVSEVLEVEGERIVGATRSNARRRYAMNIAATTTALDRRVIRHVVDSQGNFVRNAIGERADVFSRQARSIVAQGLASGLGRDDITGRLSRELTASGFDRQRSYYQNVATIFANRSRTFGQLSSFNDAGIARFIFEAMLDEATSDICRFMHGKIFDVPLGLDLFSRVEGLADPLEIKTVQPFVRTRETPEGDQVLAFGVGEERTTVARIVESGVGRSDVVGRYADALSPVQLQAAGVTMPPLHGMCRSTIVPDV